jgi:hypothetical protein
MSNRNKIAAFENAIGRQRITTSRPVSDLAETAATDESPASPPSGSKLITRHSSC